MTLLFATAVSNDFDAPPAPERGGAKDPDIVAGLAGAQMCARLCRFML